MDASKTPRWVWIALAVVLGLVLVSVWPTPGTEPADDAEPGDDAAEAAVDDGDAADVEPTGPATRSIAPNCVPADAAKEYAGFLDKRALVVLSWDGMSERAEELEIPVHVVGIEEDGVAVRFLQFPMQEQYIHIWLGSGHIKAGEERVFILDPCSAKVLDWPEMERGDPDEDE